MIDSSGSGAHGTADEGLAAQSPVTGVINQALAFGESNIRLDVNAGAFAEFTIAGWLYLPDQASQWSTIIGFDNEWGIQCLMPGGNNRHSGVWDEPEILDHGANFPFDVWFHFAMVIQASTL